MTDWPSLLAEHGPRVWRTIYRVLCHHADASDCYQETFLAAWRFAERQPVADWRSFLTSLATRRAIDRLRQRVRARSVFAPLDGAPEPPGGDGPVEDAHLSELIALVRAGLARLPEKQAEVFWLSCVEGLTHAQISEQLSVPPGEVRVLLHRARGRLQHALAAELTEAIDKP